MDNFTIDSNEIKTFLQRLDPRAEQFSWRILKHGGGAQNLEGSFEQLKDTFESASKNSAQIFIMINRSDGMGQTGRNILGVRALFVDLDGTPLQNIERIHLSPQMVVETSPGKYHAYWLVSDVPLDEFTMLQKRLACIVGSDPAVCDLPRIMRLPGTWHTKGDPFQSKIIELTQHEPYTIEQIYAVLAEHDATPSELDPPRQENHATYSLDEGLPDGFRTSALTHLAGKIIAQRVDDSTALARLFQWNALNTPPLALEKIQKTYLSLKNTHSRNHSETDLSLDDLNENYAVVVVNGSTKILRENPTQAFFSERDFHLRHRQDLILGADGKIQQLSKKWLSEPHRVYDDLIFDPSNMHADYQYNLWKGFALSPKRGSCSLYLEHLKNCICNGDPGLYEYVFNWMAHLVQKPAELPGVALVLIGDQGTGKGSFVAPLGEILGQHYQHATQMDKVLGRFNMHMAHALLVFCDEIVWGGNKKDEGALKGLVTEHDRLVEAKFQNPITLPSYLRLIFATNEAWAVPTGEKERRWCVLKVNNNHIQDTAYFGALKNELANGGSEALLDQLLSRDITSFNVRKTPKTGGLLEQKILSQGSVANWWFDRLNIGGLVQPNNLHSPYLNEKDIFDGFVATDNLLEDYLFTSKNDRHGHGKVSNGQQLLGALKPLCSFESARKQTDNGRQRGVTLPTLETCRKKYEAHIGHEIKWPKSD